MVGGELQYGGIGINRELNTQSEVENGQTLGWREGRGKVSPLDCGGCYIHCLAAQCALCIQHFLRLLGTAGAVGCHMEVSPLDCEGYNQ